MRALRLCLEIFAVAVFAYHVLIYTHRRLELARTGEPGGLPKGLVNSLGLFLAEYAALLVTLLTLPLGVVWPFRMRPASHRLVILVHGYLMTRANFLLLAWRLRRDGCEAIAGVNYRTLRGDFQEMVRRLSKEIERALEVTGHSQVDIVAHSLGGLVSLACLRDPAVGRRVRRLVTVGTPHRGTTLARLVVFDPFARELAPGSGLLAELARESPASDSLAITAIYSPFDAVVVPPSLARCAGATNVEVDGLGHHALLLSPKVYRLIAEALEE